MRKLLFTLPLAAIALFSSCKEEPLTTFGDDHYLYFDKYYMNEKEPGKHTADSTFASFFFLSDDIDALDAMLEVHLAGRNLTKDETFKLRVIPEGTSANPDEYKLADTYTFRARPAPANATNRTDTVVIKMYRKPRLKDLPKGVRLMVELVPLGDLQLGQTERTKAIVILTRDAIKPAWWNKEVTELLLGEYSSRKYKLFVTHIDPTASLNESMLSDAPWKARKLVQKFKEWLGKHPDQAVEEDGSPMTVKV